MSMRTLPKCIMRWKPLQPIPLLSRLQPHTPLHSLMQLFLLFHKDCIILYCCVGFHNDTSLKNCFMLLKRARRTKTGPCCYLGIVRPCVIIPLSLRCRSSLSRVSRISLSTAVSGSSRGQRYDESSRPESSELGDRVEDRGGSLGTGGWISLWEDRRKPGLSWD